MPFSPLTPQHARLADEAAAALEAACGRVAGDLELSIGCTGHRCRLSLVVERDDLARARSSAAQPPPARRAPEGPPPPGFRPLSPLEAKIVAGLGGGAWVVTAALAESIGEELTSDFRAIVRNLSECGTLETNQRLGVRLTGQAGGI
jgi:hypothetical protein